MTTPSAPENGEPTEGVNLGKEEPAAEAPFDPYRFGKPDYPVPAEYAPPGYTGPVAPPATPPATPYGQPAQPPWGAPYGAPPGNPFNNPPGTPYGEPQPPPSQYPVVPPGQYGPPPPMYHGYAPPRTGSGKAVAALVLGIASILFCWLSFFDAVFVIPGLIFAIIAISETKPPATTGRGMAVAGLVCTIVGALLATVFTVVIIHAANACGGFSNSNQPGWDTCIRNHIG